VNRTREHRVMGRCECSNELWGLRKDGEFGGAERPASSAEDIITDLVLIFSVTFSLKVFTE
jgi:hypothetical protein